MGDQKLETYLDMPQVRKHTVFYECCECKVPQRWEKSRCDTILSDGLPCDHARNEHHCRILKVEPNRDDRFLPRVSSHSRDSQRYHVQSARSALSSSTSPNVTKQDTSAPPPLFRANPTKQGHTELQQQVAVSTPHPSPSDELTDLNVDSSRALLADRIESDEEVQDHGSKVTVWSPQHEQQSSQSPSSLTEHASSHGEASTAAVTANEVGGARTLPDPTDSTQSGTSRPTKKTRGGSKSRPKYGTRLYNYVSGIWSLACFYDKFLQGHSDCVHFACQTEKDLHRRHMQKHVEQQDISSEEYTRLTRARNFRLLENSTFTAKEQDWRHWQKQFVAIYPVFREAETDLNPEKDQPLLQDTSLFEELRRRQLRRFEDSGSPLPYAYLPRRAELADLNTRWTISAHSRSADHNTLIQRPMADTAVREVQLGAKRSFMSEDSCHDSARQDDHAGSDSLPACTWSECSPFEDLDGLSHDFNTPSLAVEASDIDATPSSTITTDAASVFSPDLDRVSTPATECGSTPPGLVVSTSNFEGDTTSVPDTQQRDSMPCNLVGYHNQEPIEALWVEGDDSEFAQFMSIKRNEARLEALLNREPKDQLDDDFGFIDGDVD